MKLFIIYSLVLLIVITPAYGQLSDATGLINRLNIETSGHNFEVILTSNFDLIDYDFDKNKKQLILYFDSGLENNLGEIVIPSTLLNGDFTFHLNEQEFFPKIKSSEKVHFITFEFTGSGSNIISITGSEYLVGLDEMTPNGTNSLDSFTDNDFLPPDRQFDTTPTDDYFVWVIGAVIAITIGVIAVKKFLKK